MSDFGGVSDEAVRKIIEQLRAESAEIEGNVYKTSCQSYAPEARNKGQIEIHAAPELHRRLPSCDTGSVTNITIIINNHLIMVIAKIMIMMMQMLRITMIIVI